MYCDMFGQPTHDSSMINSFNLTKNNVKEIAKYIAYRLSKDTIFFNIQIQDEFSQYDVVMSFMHFNQGKHQRGIRFTDLVIGVIGSGCYGFYCDRLNTTTPSYYEEKLGVYSELLTELFNGVRNEIGGW